jgi:hypothetical protein
MERGEPTLGQCDAEQAGSGAGVEDPPPGLEQALADVCDGTR